MAEERLQKILARAGVASRRVSEELIREGRVTVDGEVVTEMGVRVDPATAKIMVDGRPLVRRERPVYLALNKPRGYVTTAGDDPLGRPTVLDLVKRPERVYPVGRLDVDTEGLLILTNDGELANRMMHPRYYLQREYIAKVRDVPSPEALRQLRQGVPTRFQPHPSPPDRVDLLERLEGGRAALVRVIIHEGAKRQVRDMLEEVGHPVLSLRRTRVGPVFLGELRRGAVRELTPVEVAELRRLVRLSVEGSRPVPAPGRPRPERPTPVWRRPPAAGAPASTTTPAERPPRPPRRPWWASELDEHPPQYRTWHAPGAQPPPGRPAPQPVERPRGETPVRPQEERPRGQRPARPAAGGNREAVTGPPRPTDRAKTGPAGRGRPAGGRPQPAGGRPSRPAGGPGTGSAGRTGRYQPPAWQERPRERPAPGRRSAGGEVDGRRAPDQSPPPWRRRPADEPRRETGRPSQPGRPGPRPRGRPGGPRPPWRGASGQGQQR